MFLFDDEPMGGTDGGTADGTAVPSEEAPAGDEEVAGTGEENADQV